MDMQAAIRAVTGGRDLEHNDMQQVMRTIMTGAATQAQIGGFLVGLRMKGETVDEITAAAGVMRELATHVDVSEVHLVDTCGTGGDGASTFNISTAAALVVAAAGAKVAKHGNRSISSKSGSADLLEAAGVNLNITPEQVARCIDEIGVGFMFAPAHHSAMRHAIGPRKEMGVRTLFNLLGPLTNPAGAPNQVIGVFARAWIEPLAHVLKQLGSQHVMVVHAHDGMDEISIDAPTDVAELKKGIVTTYSIEPEDYGMSRKPITDLVVANVEESLAMVRSVLNGERGAATDIVTLNAGAAIYTAGIAEDLQRGIKKAATVIASGDAGAKLEALVKLSNSF